MVDGRPIIARSHQLLQSPRVRCHGVGGQDVPLAGLGLALVLGNQVPHRVALLKEYLLSKLLASQLGDRSARFFCLSSFQGLHSDSNYSS